MKPYAVLLALVGCVPIADGEFDSIGDGPAGLVDGEPAAAAILTLVDHVATSPEDLQGAFAAISDDVAREIFDNRPHGTLARLDDVPYVGSRVADALYERARDHGLVVEAASIQASWLFTRGGVTTCPFGATQVVVTARELDAAGDTSEEHRRAYDCLPGTATLGPLRGGRYLVTVQAVLGADRPQLASPPAVVDLTAGDRLHAVAIAIPPP